MKDCQQEIYFESHSCILSDFDSLDEATAGSTHLGGDFRMRLLLERHLCFYQQNPSCPSVAKTNTFTGLHVDSRSCLGCQRWRSTGLIPKCLLGMNQLRTKTCKYRAFIIITELAYVSDAACFGFDSDHETTARGHQSNIGECWTFFKIRNVFRYQPPTSESH